MLNNYDKHYNDIIDITKKTIPPHYVDYSDCSKLAYAVDNIMSREQSFFNQYIDLYEELLDMSSALVTHGLDYGTNIRWDKYTQQLIDIFPNKYIKNYDNLKILFDFIKDIVDKERE